MLMVTTEANKLESNGYIVCTIVVEITRIVTITVLPHFQGHAVIPRGIPAWH